VLDAETLKKKLNKHKSLILNWFSKPLKDSNLIIISSKIRYQCNLSEWAVWKKGMKHHVIYKMHTNQIKMTSVLSKKQYSNRHVLFITVIRRTFMT
jgi:hypothetical protein